MSRVELRPRVMVDRPLPRFHPGRASCSAVTGTSRASRRRHGVVTLDTPGCPRRACFVIQGPHSLHIRQPHADAHGDDYRGEETDGPTKGTRCSIGSLHWALEPLLACFPSWRWCGPRGVPNPRIAPTSFAHCASEAAPNVSYSSNRRRPHRARPGVVDGGIRWPVFTLRKLRSRRRSFTFAIPRALGSPQRTSDPV